MPQTGQYFAFALPQPKQGWMDALSQRRRHLASGYFEGVFGLLINGLV
jgi:hypothetical protein